MVHQCVHCGKIIEAGSKEILEGCNSCKGKFFFYIRDEQLARIRQQQAQAQVQKKLAEEELLEIYEDDSENESEPEIEVEIENVHPIIELNKTDKQKVEKDVRNILGIDDEAQPVILDFESVRVLKPGKFEIDIVGLMNRYKPIVFKLQEGKYIIDLESGMPKRYESDKQED